MVKKKKKRKSIWGSFSGKAPTWTDLLERERKGLKFKDRNQENSQEEGLPRVS